MSASSARAGALVVVDPGWGTTAQDHGRPGLAHLGVTTSGAVDRVTHDLVNRLVGNDPAAATLETLGGLTLEARTPVIVARSTDTSRHVLRTGERIRVDPAPGELWGYLAVRGGFDLPVTLGSRSRDTLAGLGPRPLASGDVLVTGTDPGTEFGAEHAPSRRDSGPLRVWPGPHVAWFTDQLDALTALRWTVTADVSRVGARLERQTFTRAVDADTMPSAGLVPGAVQITPSGEPIVMLADHPTSGGYPVIAVVDPDDLARVAQSRPGTTLTFRHR